MSGKKRAKRKGFFFANKLYQRKIHTDALSLASLDGSFEFQNHSNPSSIWIVSLETRIIDLTWQVKFVTIKNLSFWVAIFIWVTSNNCETGISRVDWWIEEYFILKNSTAFVHFQLNVIGVQLNWFSTRSPVDSWSNWKDRTWRRGSRRASTRRTSAARRASTARRTTSRRTSTARSRRPRRLWNRRTLK